MDLVNMLEASEVRTFGDRRLPAKLVLTPVNKSGQQTILYTKEQAFNVGLDQSFFSQQNMKRVR